MFVKIGLLKNILVIVLFISVISLFVFAQEEAEETEEDPVTESKGVVDSLLGNYGLITIVVILLSVLLFFTLLKNFFSLITFFIGVAILLVVIYAVLAIIRGGT